MIVIGYGTGRCGTQSLASFLNQQEGFNITHEKVPKYWCPQFSEREEVPDIFAGREEKVIGDIGFYWIHYIPNMLKRSDTKVINIIRNDDEVIESFWTYKSPDSVNLGGWFGYPYQNEKPTKDAIAKTVRSYRRCEKEYKKKFPNTIYQMDITDLNSEDKLHNLLTWLDVDCKRNMTIKHIDIKRIKGELK